MDYFTSIRNFFLVDNCGRSARSQLFRPTLQICVFCAICGLLLLAVARHKLPEFATGGVISHMKRQVSFIIKIQKREQRATFIVDIVQDQLSWR